MSHVLGDLPYVRTYLDDILLLTNGSHGGHATRAMVSLAMRAMAAGEQMANMRGCKGNLMHMGRGAGAHALWHHAQGWGLGQLLHGEEAAKATQGLCG